MELSIVERSVDNVTVLDLKGDMTAGHGCELFQEKVLRVLAASKKPQLLLNMEGLTGIDSPGVGRLKLTYTDVRRQWGTVKLLHLTKGVSDSRIIAELILVFESYTDEADAIKSYPREAVKS